MNVKRDTPESVERAYQFVAMALSWVMKSVIAEQAATLPIAAVRMASRQILTETVVLRTILMNAVMTVIVMTTPNDAWQEHVSKVHVLS